MYTYRAPKNFREDHLTDVKLLSKVQHCNTYRSNAYFSFYLPIDLGGYIHKVKNKWRVWVRRVGCIDTWWGNPRERDHCGDLGIDGWIILGWVSRRWDVGIWSGLGWPRIEKGGGGL